MTYVLHVGSRAAQAALLLACLLIAASGFAATVTATLEVNNMVCSRCSAAVHKALMKVPGVHAATVDVQAKRAVVTFDTDKTTPAALSKATRNAGFPSTVFGLGQGAGEVAAV